MDCAASPEHKGNLGRKKRHRTTKSPPPKHPRLDLNDVPKNVLEEKELIALEEAKIPGQLETLSTTKFPKTVDWKNQEIYHGLRKIISKGKLDGTKLVITHKCICGMKFKRYKLFVDHFHNNSTSTSVDYTFRCSLCGKNFSESTGLTRHNKAIHGIPQDDKSEKIKKDGHKELLALEEAKIPSQLKNLSTKKFKRVPDMGNPSIFHGLKSILSDGKIIDLKLSKTYVCLCGVKFEKHNHFQTHYNPHLPSDFKCSTCGKGFKDGQGLQAHSKAVHGVSTQDGGERFSEQMQNAGNTHANVVQPSFHDSERMRAFQEKKNRETRNRRERRLKKAKGEGIQSETGEQTSIAAELEL